MKPEDLIGRTVEILIVDDVVDSFEPYWWNPIKQRARINKWMEQAIPNGLAIRRKAPNNLWITHGPEHYRKELQYKLGSEWMVVGFGAALAGRRFDLIIHDNLREEHRGSRSEFERKMEYIRHAQCRLSPQGRIVETW